jgi:hypothetical protein
MRARQIDPAGGRMIGVATHVVPGQLVAIDMAEEAPVEPQGQVVDGAEA